jgi:hypothetical protein
MRNIIGGAAIIVVYYLVGLGMACLIPPIPIDGVSAGASQYIIMIFAPACLMAVIGFLYLIGSVFFD